MAGDTGPVAAPGGLPPLPTIVLPASPAELRQVTCWLLEDADLVERRGPPRDRDP